MVEANHDSRSFKIKQRQQYQPNTATTLSFQANLNFCLIKHTN